MQFTQEDMVAFLNDYFDYRADFSLLPEVVGKDGSYDRWSFAERHTIFENLTRAGFSFLNAYFVNYGESPLTTFAREIGLFTLLQARNFKAASEEAVADLAAGRDYCRKTFGRKWREVDQEAIDRVLNLRKRERKNRSRSRVPSAAVLEAGAFDAPLAGLPLDDREADSPELYLATPLPACV